MDSPDEEPREVDQIFQFLKDKRNVETSVCQTFKDEMMDFTAVKMASDKDFQALGLQRRGDILALRSFVSSGADKEKKGHKRKLLELSKQLSSKSTRSKTASSGPRRKFQSSEEDNPPPMQSSKKVQIGWQHFNNQENRYVGVRMVKGGGTRELSIPLNASSGEVVDLMKDVFFPDGISIFGSTDQMTLKLGNFKCEEIINEEFTLAKYIVKHKLTKVRLYILTSFSEKQDKQSEVHYVSDNDCDLLTPAFGEQGTSPGDRPSDLLGSSEDRKSLRESQDEEYLDSLANDITKESKKREELLRCQEKTARQESLRAARAMRVSDEPEMSEPHIQVSVRHITLGVQTRIFEKGGEVATVYDWVGSLSLTPEHFTLSTPDDGNLNPSLCIETVDRVMLSMSACEKSPAFPDEIVAAMEASMTSGAK